jgi:hypothetical protein
VTVGIVQHTIDDNVLGSRAAGDCYIYNNV